MLGEYALSEVEISGLQQGNTPKQDRNGTSPMGSMNTIIPRGNVNQALAQASVQAK